MADVEGSLAEGQDSSFSLSSFAGELFGNPLNAALCVLCIYLAYRLFGDRWQFGHGGDVGAGDGLGGADGRGSGLDDTLRMKRRDFTLEQLAEFDGRKNPRILLAVNKNVFDVSRGRRFYGSDGPYGIFAGKDASRGLATFCLDREALRDTYDDLADLTPVQMESVREWDMQFKEKYDYVGKLLRPGEEPSEYTDEEDIRDSQKDD
uniref:membrane-associated progesterone receptor component 2 n=1 Tax=Myxine glutinosa TaxID=7769 RepID=UPI00358E8B6A